MNLIFLYLLSPVGIAGWFLGIKTSIFYSIICTIAWFYADYIATDYSSSFFTLSWNAFIRFSTFSFIGWSFGKINILLESEKDKSESLKKALSEIKMLESFLSICCVCKKIRNEEGAWQQLESYISNHSEVRFSHGYCPECLKKARIEAGLPEK